jgi:hypothetical protein
MFSITTWKLGGYATLLSLVLAFPGRPTLAQAVDPAAPQAAPAPASTTPPDSPAVPTPAPAATAPVADAPATDAPAARHRHTAARYTKPTLDDRIAVLSKNLQLTEPQRVALKNILIDRQQQSLRIRNANVPGDVRIGRFRALQDRTVDKIRSILTDEQKKKYDPALSRTVPPPDVPQRSLEDWIKATTPH